MPSLGRALLLSAAVAVPAAAVVMEDVVAKVNGKPLLLSEYRKNLKSVLDQWGRSIPGLMKDQEAVSEIRRKVLDQMVDDELLAQEAERLKLKVFQRELDKGVEEVQERSFRVDEESGRRRDDREMQAALAEELKREGLNEEQFRERIRRQLLIRKVVEDQVRGRIKEPEDKRVREAFDKLRAVISEGTSTLKGMPEEEAQAYGGFAMQIRDRHAERVRVQHILVKAAPNAPIMEKNKALERAQALKKRVEADEDFGEVAAKESDDADSAPRGGDLGFVLKGWMPPEFEKKAFSLGVGEVSDPVETSFGYHLIRVTEKKAREAVSFEKLKLDVKQFLYTLDSQKELMSYVKQLRAKATIEEKLPKSN